MGLTFVKIFNRFVTAGAVMGALFLFASFFPAGLYPWLYATVFGVRVNMLYLAIVVFGGWMLAKKTYSSQVPPVPIADLPADGGLRRGRESARPSCRPTRRRPCAARATTWSRASSSPSPCSTRG